MRICSEDYFLKLEFKFLPFFFSKQDRRKNMIES